MRINHSKVKTMKSLYQYVLDLKLDSSDDIQIDKKCYTIKGLINKYKSPFGKIELHVGETAFLLLQHNASSILRQPMTNFDLLRLMEMDNYKEFMINRLKGMDTLMLQDIHKKMEF